MGKDKLKRFRDNEGFEHVFQPGFKEVYQTDYRLKGKWRSKYFKNQNPIVLELGCGKGEYTVGLAERNPNINYIGIDIKGARIWRGAKTVHEKGMKNVAFVRTSINLVESVFDAGEIDEIWLTFSDPQPKRYKRRLSSSVFLNYYKKLLKDNGLVHVKTDSRLLFEYTNALAEVNDYQINYCSRDVYSDSSMPEPVIGIQTFYENQFRGKGCKIHYLQFHLPLEGEIIEPEKFNEVEAVKYK